MNRVTWFQQLFHQHRTELLMLLGTLLLCAVLRLSRFPTEIIWNGDTARDMIVARHLWLYDENLDIGHSAYGLRIDSPQNEGNPYGMSHYPSYYFRLMSLLWGISGDVYRLHVLMIFFQIVGLAVLYVGLRQLFGWRPAVLAIGAVAISMKAVEHSLGVAIHPSLVVAFSIFTLLVIGWKQCNYWLMGSAALLCIVGTLIHYSFLVCFAWVVALSCWRVYQMKRIAPLILFAVLSLVSGAALFLLLHLEIINYYGFLPFFGTFTGQYKLESLSFSQVYSQFMDILLFRLRGIFPIWTSICAAISIGTTA